MNILLHDKPCIFEAYTIHFLTRIKCKKFNNNSIVKIHYKIKIIKRQNYNFFIKDLIICKKNLDQDFKLNASSNFSF
jgi:hypothetical protein